MNQDISLADLPTSHQFCWILQSQQFIVNWKDCKTSPVEIFQVRHMFYLIIVFKIVQMIVGMHLLLPLEQKSFQK